MNAGKLRHRLIFMVCKEGQDADGFPIDKKIEYARSWASLKTLKGSTFYAAASTNMAHNREFTIRYQKGLDFENRPDGLTVMWKNKEHEIESIENDDGLNVSMTVILKAVSQ